ncbi:hypothetical protein CEXT_95971 [Caerostris extrusa]|uniref:Uncharacterized protein n=1 Tax=Caerostris extrusa TaxID=172846 RepID=A0AAV4Q0S6_CAEEX|nr:hypothetical protein CEXT_95971 [Caerostris extrusa]
MMEKESKKGKTILERFRIRNPGQISHQKNEYVSTVLHKLASSSDTDKLEEIVTYLKSGSDVKKRGVDGNTALHLAALNPIDNFKTISTLIKFGSDVNAENSDKNTALHFAVIRGKKLVIYLLLNEGADINHQDSWGNTALHYSVDSCSYWKKTNRNHQCTAKHNHGDIKILKNLLTSGADANPLNRFNDTPLMWATRDGHFDIVLTLLEFQASIILHNNDLKTPLHFVFDSRQPDFKNIVELIKRGTTFRMLDSLTESLLVHILQEHESYQPAQLANTKALIKSKTLVFRDCFASMPGDNAAMENVLVNYMDESFQEVCFMESLYLSPEFSIYNLL